MLQSMENLKMEDIKDLNGFEPSLDFREEQTLFRHYEEDEDDDDDSSEDDQWDL